MDQFDPEKDDIMDEIGNMVQGAHIHETDGPFAARWKRNREVFKETLGDDKLDTILEMLYNGLDDLDTTPSVPMSQRRPVVDTKVKKAINSARRAGGMSTMGTKTLKQILNPDD